MNQYTLDGVPLKDPELRWFTDRETGIRIVPARRQAEQRYPHEDGVNFIPASPYDPGQVAIQLQVTGKTYLEFRENLEFIVGVMTQRNKLLELRDHYEGSNPSSDRVAMVTLSASSEPVMIDRQSALVSVLFSVPGTFWRSADEITGMSPEITALGLSGYSIITGGNAPIDDMILRIRGAFSSLYIEDVVTKSRIDIEVALNPDETMLIDPVAWKAIIVPGVVSDTWSIHQGRDVSGYVTPSSGYGSMFRVEPELAAGATALVYRVNAEATNIRKPVTIEYRTRRSYL